MTTQKQATGQWGEETAARYLENNGYTILARNFHTAHGEIDIVASKEGGLVFVEVKRAVRIPSPTRKIRLIAGNRPTCSRPPKITCRRILKAAIVGSLM